MPTSHSIGAKPSPIFWILGLFLALLFATGGASRTDAQSLVILRPLSVIVCATAFLTLRREHLVQKKWLIISITFLLAVSLLHVVPLPPVIWQSLAGRGELVDVEVLVGLESIWRPLTLAPMNGWHALLSLFVPLGVILLGVQLSRDDLFRLLPLLIALAGISGLVGLLQAIGDPNSALYFYRITNNGSAVGLFANRNHAATLLGCMFPMLAVFASTGGGTNSEVRLRQLIAASIAIVLIPLILVTGSRSGLISTFIGIVAAAILYRRPVNARSVRKKVFGKVGALPLLSVLAAVSLGFLTFFFSRAQAIERLFVEASREDNRTDFWVISLNLFWKYFPWGSGSGSFVEAFQIVEPDYMLDATYLNHAHSDWIEVAVTFGLPGVIGLALATAAFLWRSFGLWHNAEEGRRYLAFGRLASVCIAIIAIASIADYPLRTPTMMGVFAVFALWFSEGDVRSPSVIPAKRSKS